jgi:outer membrane protein assembly factor BamB
MQTSTPAYGNGKILVATFDGYIFAFDAITGQECWNKKVSDTIFQCPITCYDGKFYIGDGGTGGETNNYYCIDSDGNVIWTYPAATAGYLWAGASVIGDYLVFGNRESVLTSLNRHNGEPVDILDLTTIHPDAGKIRASVTYHNGYVYNTSQSMSDEGYIWKTGFDPNTGNFTGSAWNNPIGFSTSTPVVHEGKVYIGEGEHGCPGSLICLNDTSGIIEWQYPVPMGVKSSPALSVQNGTAYIYFTIAQNDGLLYCVKADGTLAWSWDPPDEGYIVQGAAISEGMVFFGNSSGNIYALRECPDWDLNGDGEIDIGDIAVVGLHWNETGSPGWIPEDLSPDGIIDIGDIAVIGMHWSN